MGESATVKMNITMNLFLFLLTQIKDAVHDGLRAVKNAIEDGKQTVAG